MAVDGLVKRYGQATALQGISLTVSRAEVHGLIGPNGAGKTSALECLLGLRAADGGTVTVFGMDPWRDRERVFSAVGAYLQEDAGLQRRLRVGEAMRAFATFYRDPEPPDSLLDQLGLTAHRRAAYGDLSGGEKARLHLALALVGRPSLLVLDEPTAGLDPAGRRDVWLLVRRLCAERGLAVLVSTHHLVEAERHCDRVTMLARGAVVLCGRPRELLDAHAFDTYLEVTGGSPPIERFKNVTWSVPRTDGVDVVTASTQAAAAVQRWATRHGGCRVSVRPASLEDLFLARVAERDP
ncbi:MAG TPA: ABC transporter ATP-binding protein [Frankiaceae bacterium]|nr:ABC transporter ATP-binding protein [Frankiaceae bacterium]